MSNVIDINVKQQELKALMTRKTNEVELEGGKFFPVDLFYFTRETDKALLLPVCLWSYDECGEVPPREDRLWYNRWVPKSQTKGDSVSGWVLMSWVDGLYKHLLKHIGRRTTEGKWLRDGGADCEAHLPNYSVDFGKTFCPLATTRQFNNPDERPFVLAMRLSLLKGDQHER